MGRGLRTGLAAGRADLLLPPQLVRGESLLAPPRKGHACSCVSLRLSLLLSGAWPEAGGAAPAPEPSPCTLPKASLSSRTQWGMMKVEMLSSDIPPRGGLDPGGSVGPQGTND